MMSTNKEQINVVVIGHVDAGKSTTTGHLIFQLGGIEARTVEKYKKMSEEDGKGTFCFAWIFDRLKEERERGITINCSLSAFETDKFKVTIIDAPGHKDFIKNMLTGTSQADAAILVISAKSGEFEAGISKEGSTKEHALLSFALGIKQMIVLVNKMDDVSVNYKQERFEEVVSNATNFLTKIGFKKENLQFVPISGWKGENLVKPTTEMKWYQGSTVSGAIDNLSPPKRVIDKPLRMPIQDVYKISGVGTVISGKIESGVVKPGMSITIMPCGITAEVRSVEQHRQPLKEGLPGQTVGINVRGVSSKEVKRGCVVGPAGKDAPSVVTKFTAQLMILNHPKEIRVGYTPVVDCHTNHVACKLVEIIDKKEKKGESVLNPPSIKNGDNATCVFVPQKPISIETFKTFNQLGRFAVRDMQKTVAVGVVTYIETTNNSK